MMAILDCVYRKILLLTLSVVCPAFVFALHTEEIDGIAWDYEIESNGVALVGVERLDKDRLFDGRCVTLPRKLVEKPVRKVYGNLFWKWHEDTESIIIPASVELIVGPYALFDTLQNLKEYIVDTNSKSFKSVDGVLYSFDGLTLVDWPSGKSGCAIIPTGVTRIQQGAFRYCPKVTCVSLPATLRSIEAYEFVGCKQATNISMEVGNTHYKSVLGGLYTKDEKTIIAWPRGRAGCATLSSVTLKIEDGAFHSSHSLSNVVLPSGLLSIGSYSFSKCTALNSIEVPDTVIRIGVGAFLGCESLKVALIGTHVREIGNSAFAECGHLRSVQIPDNCEHIGVEVFANCSMLTRIHVPSSVRTLGAKAFRGCQSLMMICVEDGLTDIGENVFYGCAKLQHITLPASLRHLGRCAFMGCEMLKTVEFLGDAPYVERFPSIFEGTPPDLEVVVYEGTKGWDLDLGEWPRDKKVGRRKLRVRKKNASP